MTNSKSTKRALVSSAFAIVMCLAMFIGTTFAWFTDSASTAVNKIQSGTLKVELWNADNTAKLDADEALTWEKASGHENETVLWEPGCTYNLKSFRIKNNGNLALKYKVLISGVVGDENPAKLLEVIDFSAKVGDTDVAALDSWEGNLAAGAVTDAITITGKMQTTAGNEYQNLSIDGVYIIVVATQDTVENDSYDNQYDKDATYPDVYVNSVAKVNEAIKAGNSAMVVENFTANVNYNSTTAYGDENFVDLAALHFDKNEYPTMADTITIYGDGTVKSNQMAIWAQRGIHLVINGGTYDNTSGDKGVQLIYANNDASIIVNEGTFMSGPTGEIFNISNPVKDGNGGTIIIKGGLYNKPLKGYSEKEAVTAWQAADNYNEETGIGIKIADGYKQVEVEIDGVTWYQVVKDTTA